MSRSRSAARIATVVAVAALAAGLSTTAASAEEGLAPFGSGGKFVPISEGLVPIEGFVPISEGLVPISGGSSLVPIVAGGLAGANTGAPVYLGFW